MALFLVKELMDVAMVDFGLAVVRKILIHVEWARFVLR